MPADAECDAWVARTRVPDNARSLYLLRCGTSTGLQYRSGVSTPPRTVFTDLLDDAAMFPPGNAGPSEALTEHLRHRGEWYADLVGPLLVPAGRWDAFVMAHELAAAPEVTVVLIGTTTGPASVPAAVTIAGFEALVPDVPLPEVATGLSFAAEIALGESADRVLSAVGHQAGAGRPVVAKFRTGGVSADAFPSEPALAAVIASAVAFRAPLKLTAGLHHAVRSTDPETGFEQHGFLNVLLGFAGALAGRDVGWVSDTLAVRHGATLVAGLRELSPGETRAIRRAFVSFGCCGVEDPVHDLLSLDLLEVSAADTTKELDDLA